MVDLSDCRNADSGSNIFHFKKIIPAKNQNSLQKLPKSVTKTPKMKIARNVEFSTIPDYPRSGEGNDQLRMGLELMVTLYCFTKLYTSFFCFSITFI